MSANGLGENKYFMKMVALINKPVMAAERGTEKPSHERQDVFNKFKDEMLAKIEKMKSLDPQKFLFSKAFL